MSNQLQIFENKEFGTIRVIDIDGLPWFVGSDVTKRMGYRNSRDALAKHVDAEDKGVANCDTNRGRQNLTVINESGLYSLIFSSKLPVAKSFTRWITTEVLPSIRKHGAYVTDDILKKLREDEGFAGELIGQLAEERARNAVLSDKVDALSDKARYHDVILQCENAVQIGIVAKDYGMTAAAFNKLLNGLKVQYKVGDTWVLFQSHADKGYTVTRTYHVNENTAKLHTYWTQSGRRFLYDILKWYGILPCAERPGGAVIGGECDSCSG